MKKTKKRILIVDYKMSLGGIAIAMINLFENLKNEFDIELLLCEKGGELEGRIPKDIKVHYLGSPLDICNHNKTINKPLKLLKLFFKVFSKFISNRMLLKFLAKRCKSLGKYDLVINNNMDMYPRSFYGPCHNYSIFATNTKKRFIIIHGDYVKNKYDSKFTRKEYSRYDKILCVSKTLAAQMSQVVPKLSSKIDYLYNFQDVIGIKKLSKHFKIDYSKDVLNIVSVSRLTEVKGYLRSLKVLLRLKNEGYKFCWHIVGSGEQQKDIEDFISSNQLEGYIKLWGLQPNPFPYIAKADLMYLGSYHESYGLVLIEAMVLGIPCLSTEVLPAKELLDGFGFICENSEDGIYNQIKLILDDKTQLNNFAKKLKSYNYDNDSIKIKFRKFINE